MNNTRIKRIEISTEPRIEVFKIVEFKEAFSQELFPQSGSSW